ncbi:hypothetical protein [Nonomuraea sp. NPDC049480]|uniref:hypothetical protein n=1 Tax=Nonomuraea sp. NPDC049480 TaxID=3364353 RepID=UPI0037AA485A
MRLPKGAQFMRCVSHWCVGEVKGRMIVQRVDGSGLRTLPPELRIYAPHSPHGERFALAAVIEPDKNKPGVPLAVVYDMATGTMAGLGQRILGTVGVPVLAGNGSSAPSLTPYWDQDVQIRQSCEKKRCIPRSYGGGKEYTLLNLAAVTG